MSGLFNFCQSLKEVDLSNLNLDEIICLDQMFYVCSEKFREKVNEKILENLRKNLF